MLYTQMQSHRFLGSGEDFKVFYHIAVAAILFNGAKPIEQIDDTPSTEDHIWVLVKTGQAVSKK